MKLMCTSETQDQQVNTSNKKFKIMATLLLLTFSIFFFYFAIIRYNISNDKDNLLLVSQVEDKSVDTKDIIKEILINSVNEDYDNNLIPSVKKFRAVKMLSNRQDDGNIVDKFSPQIQLLENIIDELEEMKLNNPQMVEEFYDV
jgi:hypothetical protein